MSDLLTTGEYKAIAAALELQEGRSFAALLRPFEALIEGQIAAMGTETYQRNHGG